MNFARSSVVETSEPAGLYMGGGSIGLPAAYPFESTGVASGEKDERVIPRGRRM